MSALGSLVVKLALEYAEYTRGLDKSDQDGLRFAQNAQRHFDSANQASQEFFGGVAKGAAQAAIAYFSVSSAVDAFNASIDNFASLDDMAQKTGATVETLSRLQKVAAMTGADFSSVDLGIVKLARNMANMDGEGDAASEALSKLGVSAYDTAGALRDPAEVLIDVAKGMQTYSDGAEKIGMVNDLMGKSSANLLPYLNDVVENVDKFSGVSTEAAVRASQMQDQFGLLKVRAGELKDELAAATLPAVNGITQAIIDAYKESGKLNAIWVALGGLGSVLYTDEFQDDTVKIANLRKELDDLHQDQFERATSGAGMLTKWLFGDSDQELLNKIENTKKAIQQLEDAPRVAAQAAAQKKKEDADRRKSEAEATAAALKASEAAREAKLRADQQTRELESQIKARDKFVQSLEKEKLMFAMTAAEAKIYEAVQLGITGKELDKAKALIKSNEAHKLNQKAMEDERKVSQDHIAQNLEFANSLDKNVDALRQQVDAQRDYNDRLGLSKKEIRELNGVEVERQALAKDGLATLMDQIDWTGQLGDKYREEAKLLRELNTLKNVGEDKQNGIDQMNQSLREQSDIWSSVDRTAHDTFVSLQDGGKKAAQRLKDSFNNIFYEYIYQMGKKLVVNVALGVSMTASGSAMANTGGVESMLNPSNMISAGQSLWQGFTAAGSLGNGFLGSVAGGLQGAGAGSGLTSAMGLDIGNYLQGVLGNNVAGSLSSGISSISAAMPYAAAAIAAFQISKSVNGGYRLGGLSADAGALLGFAPRLFGMKDKEMGGQTVTGALGTDNLMRNQSWTQDGGLFRSDRSGVWSYGLKDSVATTADGKSYVDSKNLDSDKALLKILNGGYDAVKSASTEFAKILGLNADQIATRNDALNLTLGKTQEENDKAIAAVFGGIADAIALDLIPNIAALKKEGESSAGTMARLAGGLLGVNNVISAMGFEKMSSDMGGAKSAQNLLDATGGMEKFSAGAAYFTENFLSEAEKMKPSIDAVASTLASLGMSNLKSVEDFKLAVVGGKDANGNLVKGLDLTSDAGQKTFASLMAISPQFKLVADYTDSLGGSLSVVESELKKTNEGWQQQIDALEKAKLSQEQLRESELTGVADSTKLLIEKAHALQDEATASAKAKAAADKLAATNESLEARIDALVKASLSLDEQRQAELTGVADSTKLLIQRVHVLEDEATASAKAKAAADKLAATNESLEARIDALVKASLSLDEQRQAELTGVADSTKLLIQRVHVLEDEATASAKAKAAADKLTATNESLQARIDALVKASLTLDQQRQSELTGVADSTKLLIQRVHVLEDEATASAKAKAAADKLAATNESLEARIDALVKASLSLDEQRQAELTGVADSTKLLIQRVHALEDEATASEKAKAAIEKLKATNDSIQQQIDSMVRASLPLDEQRKLEVIGIDGTTLALKKQLWALEDSERALLDKAAKEKQLADDKIKAQQEAESSFNKWLGDVKSAFDSESGVFKSIIDKFTQIGDSITDYRHSLDVGSHALLTPEAQYQANKADWEKLVVAIDNKEDGALEKLQAVTDAFLESSKERNASSAEYFKDVDAAKRVAEKSADIAYAHVDVAKQQLNYLEQQVKGLFDINESVKSLASLMGGSGSTAQALNSSGMSATDLVGIESNVSQNLANVGGFDSLYNKTLAGDQDAMKTLQQQMVRWAGFDLKSEQYDRLVGKDSLAKMLDLFNLRIEDFKSSLLTTWNGKEQNLNFDRSGLFAGTTSYAKIADELKAMQAAYVAPAAYNKRADIIETRLPPQFAESTRVAAAPAAVGGDEEAKKLLRRNNELMEKLINANITGSNGVVGSVKNLTQKFSGLDKSTMLEKAQGG
jgi:hypothetical protein